MLRHIKPGMLVFSVLYILLGLLLLLAPQAVADVFCIALGLLVVLCGLQSLYGYFKKDNGSIRAAVSLLLSLPTIALGMWALLCTVQSAMTFGMAVAAAVWPDAAGGWRGARTVFLCPCQAQGAKVVGGAAAQHCFAVVRGIAGVFSAAEQPQRGSFAAVRHLFTGRGHFESVLHHYIAMEFHALDRLDAAKAEMETAAAPEPSPEAPSPAPAEPAAEESAETDLPDVPAPELTTEPPEPDQEPTADAAT